MKRFLALAALVLGLASCQTEPEGLNVNVGGEVDTTVCVSLPEATRANSEVGAIANLDLANSDLTIRYILQVFYGETATPKQYAYSDGTNVAFDVRLVPGRDYKFVVWADIVEGENAGDNHYDTNDLTAITFNGDWNAMDETFDAYTAVYDTAKELDNGYQGSSNINISLTRPFAKLRVITTDMVELGNLCIVPEGVNVKYTVPVYNTFNALAGAVNTNNNVTEKTFSYNLSDTDNIEQYNDTSTSKTLFTNYLFGAENGVIKFEMSVNDNTAAKELIKFNNFNTDIPVQRNYLTTIQGNILTDGNNIKVDVQDAFENAGNLEDEPYYVEIWDGETIKVPTQNEAGNYVIERGSELAWLAAAVSGTLETRAVTADSFAGKTFVLNADIDLGGNEWTPIGMGGKHFEGTFNGQGHTIKGLMVSKHHGADQAALFCSLAGDATIKNVVIDDAYIKYPANGEDFYASAIAGTIYGTVTFENITVKNSTITGNNKVGAIFAHDGSSTQITINNCHVDNCYIASEDLKDGGNVGGLIGLYQTGSDKVSKISNSSVKNSTIVGINSTNSGKRANSQFIGGIYTKEKTNLVIENCVIENNNFSQTIDGTNAVSYVGTFNPQYIGGDRYEKHLGMVVIDGSEAIYVRNAMELQSALNTVKDGVTIQFAYDIDGDVTVVQKQGVKITIEGEGKKFNGVVKVHSNSEHYADAALTIKNVNFETSVASVNVIEALENGSERYSTNITVENCTFTATGEAVNTSVGLQIKSSKNAKVLNCTATNMHSLIQAQSCDETVVVNGCTINGKNGVAFKQVKAATVEGTTITALEYGIRFDGNIDNYGIVVKDNNVTAVQPLIVRKMTGKDNKIALEGTNTLTTDAEYQIVITNGSDDEEYAKPTGTYTLTGTDTFKVFPAPVLAKVGNVEYTSIDEAIANWTNGSTLSLIANVTLTDVITLKSTEYHILDLGTYTMTAAKSKDAIQITAEGRTSASYALDIKADATNPGGITATSKAVVKTTGKSGVQDRPIIRFYNGVFNASNVVSHSGSNGTKCPQFWFYGGVYNGSMSANRALIQIYGGTFNGKFYTSVDSSAYMLISGGKFKYLDNLYGSALNSDKITIGSSKGNFDRGIYVDDEGYFVVGGAVITEFGDMFAAKATNASKAGSYLPYSSAAEHGLYYTNASLAIQKHGEANVVLK
ncbi:MAG: right-handed parallel beta-helix repeat-containing protein [Alistipes sp.]|nr:right-handed parallel beta-helix repeat-containing protein [Alistipes sp.]